MELIISCIHTTLTSVEVQSYLERQIILIMCPTYLLEVHPLLLELPKEKTGQRILQTLIF